MLVDSHAHLDCVEDPNAVIGQAKSDGVSKIITAGTSIESSKKSIEIVDKYSSRDLKIYATVGIHPRDGKDDVEKYGYLKNCIIELRKILKQVQDDKIIVGIGETGLDYRLTTDNLHLTTNKEKKFQGELFEAQVKLAAELDLPLIIHCRNAWDEIFDSISKIQTPNSKLKGVFHSWTGDWQAAQKALDLGFYISFSGIVTYKQSLRSSSLNKFGTAGLKNAKEIQEVAKKAPLDRILVETDSPYLIPEPLRSGGPPKLTTRLSTTIRRRLVEHNWRVCNKNEPKNVRIVAQFVAGLRNLPFDEIAEATSQNARQLFGISI